MSGYVHSKIMNYVKVNKTLLICKDKLSILNIHKIMKSLNNLDFIDAIGVLIKLKAQESLINKSFKILVKNCFNKCIMAIMRRYLPTDKLAQESLVQLKVYQAFSLKDCYNFVSKKFLLKNSKINKKESPLLSRLLICKFIMRN